MPLTGSVGEEKKRRREKVYVVLLGGLFLALAWVEFRLFGISESLPLQHSIFFFGLVNFNIILFLLLVFLIFRNVVKNFAEREGGPLGSSLKSKLIAAFVGFSLVPTALMFTVSVFYINNSFDRWFNEKTSGVLKSSLEVTNTYYQNAKRNNYHFAERIVQELALEPSNTMKAKLEVARKKYALDSIEFYPDVFSDPVVAVASKDGVPVPPTVSVEVLRRVFEDGSETSTIHHFSGGDLIRVLVPLKMQKGALVISSFVPLSLITKMDDIAAAYDNFRDSDPLSIPIKSIYLIILVLMALVILTGATWFGFHLARQLSVPLERLVLATQRVSQGSYQRVEGDLVGSPEINRLIKNFNRMTDSLSKSELDLRKTMSQLDDHNRYVEVVLSRVTTGVISIDEKGQITMVNRHAEKLLNIKAETVLGLNVESALAKEHFQVFFGLVELMKANKAESVEKEVQVSVDGKPLLLDMTLTMLYDETGRELGKVLVFDDLSVVRAAQRAAAWTEVARRIAHEIKNPLTPISLAAQRLQKKFGPDISDPAFRDCTEMIVDQVNSIKDLVNEFSQFARMPKSRPVVADITRTVNEALDVFRQSESKPTLEFSAKPSIPQFLFDPDQMKRVVVNLVDNALASIAGRSNGRVGVTVDFEDVIGIVRITVSDNGVGIPKALRDRIFDPYTTTKPSGTGLGLAIVKRTVEDHNGFIRAFDNPGGGSRFVVELPLNLTNTSVIKESLQ
jgi:two-component system, NtrC family, nitrogen regulation sensor histidine kinase NtrY